LQLPERAKPQFSYFVVLDGKTPIDFEYLLRDMDVTDGIGYKSNLKDTLLFRALTAKGLSDCEVFLGNCDSRNCKGPEQGIFLKSTNGTAITSAHLHSTKRKTVALNAESLPFYKRIMTMN
jgi:signal peptidase I